MHIRQLAVLGVAVLVAASIVAGTAVGLTASQETTDGMGVQVSSFAQATAADANSSVDAGMWQAAVNQSDNPEAVIESRIDELESRLETLRNQSDRVEGNGSALGMARASAVRAEIAALKSSINETARTAGTYGVNETKLDTLRTEAANMTGPEVAALARNITDAPRGPPAEVPGNGTGPPDDGGPGNGTGPPDDGGPGNGTGPPDDGGPGNGTGPPDDDSRANIEREVVDGQPARTDNLTVITVRDAESRRATPERQ